MSILVLTFDYVHGVAFCICGELIFRENMQWGQELQQLMTITPGDYATTKSSAECGQHAVQNETTSHAGNVLYPQLQDRADVVVSVPHVDDASVGAIGDDAAQDATLAQIDRAVIALGLILVGGNQ